jgi:hypothetical protein
MRFGSPGSPPQMPGIGYFMPTTYVYTLASTRTSFS